MRAPKPRLRSGWPEILGMQLVLSKCATPTYEHRFHPTRKWRFDVAVPDWMLAVEVDGGGFVQGRHSRGTGLEKDAEKFAEAAILGWTVLRVTPRHVKSGQAIGWIQRWRQSLGRVSGAPEPRG